jgi:hypothetical protein
MTNLTADTLLHCDALNLIQAHLDHDPVMTTAIAALHPDRNQLRDLLASTAMTAVFLVRATPDGAALLAKLREHWLDEERQES